MNKRIVYLKGIGVLLLYMLNSVIALLLHPFFEEYIPFIVFLVVSSVVLLGIEIVLFKLQKYIRLKKVKLKKLFFYLLLGTIYEFLVLFLFKERFLEIDFSYSSDCTKFLFGLVSAVLIGPIVEELLFRGISIEYLKKLEVKNWIIILLSTLFFGLVHLFPFELLVLHTFVYGALIAMVYLKERNLTYCILIHSWSNLLILYILPFIFL